MIEYSNKTAVVDAIEDGRIVRVSEDYAKREGLLILRKPVEEVKQTISGKREDSIRKNKGFIGMEDLRKPLSTKNNEILRELIENFHWTLVQKRKGRLLTRKKVAEALGESEVNIKMIENGVLPADNFILINKLESYYGISLRKNKIAENKAPLRQIIDFNKKLTESKEKGIEIDDENDGANKEIKEDKQVTEKSNDYEIDVTEL
jgi:ribosome-binding protein aMBF1 (putative translation factor)